MRIIKVGQIPETVEHESTCRHCHTVFAWTTLEAKRVSDLRDGDYYDMRCPHCSAQVTVDARIIRR